MDKQCQYQEYVTISLRKNVEKKRDNKKGYIAVFQMRISIHGVFKFKPGDLL